MPALNVRGGDLLRRRPGVEGPDLCCLTPCCGTALPARALRASELDLLPQWSVERVAAGGDAAARLAQLLSGHLKGASGLDGVKGRFAV